MRDATRPDAAPSRQAPAHEPSRPTPGATNDPVAPSPAAPAATTAGLPPGLLAHLESAARAVHERWMAGRLAEGWVFGPRRDDAARTHPCLVPYEALPESEREYDRQTVRAAVEALLALGFRIEPPPCRHHAGERR